MKAVFIGVAVMVLGGMAVYFTVRWSLVGSMPSSGAATAAASPSAVNVHCSTTKGELEIVVRPDWSPRGAERFLEMVRDGFYTDLPLFRCMAGFLCQFGARVGASGSAVSSKAYPAIADDRARADLRAFKPGYLSFAGYGVGSRSTHVFIALASVPSLGTQPWETPFGYVSESSLPVLAQFETSYGDSEPRGGGPDPAKIEAADGASYLTRFPKLDRFLSCQIPGPE